MSRDPVSAESWEQGSGGSRPIGAGLAGPVAVGVTDTRSGRILNAETPVQPARVRLNRVRSVLGHHHYAVASRDDGTDSGAGHGRARNPRPLERRTVERRAVER